MMLMFIKLRNFMRNNFTKNYVSIQMVNSLYICQMISYKNICWLYLLVIN
jgi:hypothetical protein